MHELRKYTCAGMIAFVFGCSSAEPGEQLGVVKEELVTASGFWRMNDCSAASMALADSSGSGITATRGSATTCSARSNGGSAVLFDAEGEKATSPGNTNLQFSRNLGVAAWINASTINSGRMHTIVRQGATANEDIMAFQIGFGRLELTLKVRTPGTTSFQIISEKVFDRPVPTGWTHVGATWDGTTIRLYMNGVKVRENRWFTTATDIVGSSTVGIEIGGAAPKNGTSRQFFGSIDDLWVSRQRTTDADMAEVFALPSCPEVIEEKELMITQLQVVEDPVRTTNNGVWTFQHLMEAMAPTPAQAPELVRRLFSTWLSDQTVNGQTIPARSAMNTLVLTPWLNGGTTLDLSRAPLRLLAIVNRLDLRNLAQGKAGEGRFVFGVVDSSGNSTSFTIIMEYRLPATTEAQVLAWASLWHELGALQLGSAAYNTKLAEITERFAGRNAEPGRVNGSALSQLRSNEIALNFPWELREFVLDSANGFLRPDTVKLTPNSSFLNQPIVAQFINQNQAAILNETHNVPNTFNGVSFLGANSLNNIDFWNATGINNNEARHKFSLNTCNGCHGRETNTGFLQINPRSVGQPSTLAGFLTGVEVTDPVQPATVRRLDDLDRRATDMERLLCSSGSGTSSVASSPSVASTSQAAGASDSPNSFIAKGINRVH
jgi:hypothetical protein